MPYKQEEKAQNNDELDQKKIAKYIKEMFSPKSLFNPLKVSIRNALIDKEASFLIHPDRSFTIPGKKYGGYVGQANSDGSSSYHPEAIFTWQLPRNPIGAPQKYDIKIATYCYYMYLTKVNGMTRTNAIDAIITASDNGCDEEVSDSTIHRRVDQGQKLVPWLLPLSGTSYFMAIYTIEEIDIRMKVMKGLYWYWEPSLKDKKILTELPPQFTQPIITHPNGIDGLIPALQKQWPKMRLLS